MQMKESLNRYTEICDGALERFFGGFTDIPEKLKEAMAYSLFAGGKRFRPALTMAACEWFGGNAEEAADFGAAMEMIHTYSLIHDDLPAMDNDSLRRGKPTSHIVFGEAGAVLAGDALLSAALELLAEKSLQGGAYARAAYEIAKAAGLRGMLAGQWEDVETENTRVTPETLMRIHARKTAALITGSLLAGGIVGGAQEGQLAALRRLGLQMGVLFQIADDLLDVLGTKEELGKETGRDEKSHKNTYVTLFGLETAKEKGIEAENAALAILKELPENAFFTEMVHHFLRRTK